ncbi:pentatricopeptide repeat-containing protein At3g62890-like isoform X2 [Olea europaea var. sylvestris]|uniref:pentatricopeptide repeat-containing protein At3g62890-like isoform X2 n=1 Tax=Olea europaea var. sylvestris TaxID=158386 RepID=UPI000C1CF6B3|nr:pentatricopeptide repeat-containing protein At3g62890-like isoform X2 [Olea europaea var. sylvestris]
MQTQPSIQFSKRLLYNLLDKRPPISELKKIHAQIIISSQKSLTDSLIHCYLRTNNVNVARILFNNYPFPSPPTLVWNLVIRAYSKLQGDAYKVFDEMPEVDVFSWTSLLGAYVNGGEMGVASKFFEEMPVKNDVSWAVMISGCVGCGRYAEALRYFGELGKNEHNVKTNEAIVVCALSACAHLGALDRGSWIHGYIDKNGISETSNIRTALIDMYAKCGRIDCAYRVFDRISKPDVHNYTSMISGLSIHGLGEDAIRVFNQMLVDKIKPNEVTILGVLNGCSHSGMVQQGLLIFYNMENSWGIVPKIEHYGCFVDLLGRARYLAKAFGVVKSMSIDPDVVVWRALLSACRVHRNTYLGERIVNHIGQLDSQSQRGAEILLSNLYASLGKWDSVSIVRHEMSKQKNQSDIGCSWIEVNGSIHEFRVADHLHPQIIEIREKLSEILKGAGLVGYAANINHVSFDLSDEEKEQAVAWHSEKLAIAFAFISTAPKTSIRVVKNLRTCEDCHSALKAISKVYNRQIIVRDRSRFHTFRDGKCSCNDYW